MPLPSTLRATAPAATRDAVSRGRGAPPPRWSRMPYFFPVGEIGVARPKLVAQRVVILGARVLVVDDEQDGRARGASLEHAGEDAHWSLSAPLRREARLPRAPPVEPGLDVGFGEAEARRAAVDDAADRRSMALAQLVKRKSSPKLLPATAASLERMPIAGAPRVLRGAAPRFAQDEDHWDGIGSPGSDRGNIGRVDGSCRTM